MRLHLQAFPTRTDERSCETNHEIRDDCLGTKNVFSKIILLTNSCRDFVVY